MVNYSSQSSATCLRFSQKKEYGCRNIYMVIRYNILISYSSRRAYISRLFAQFICFCFHLSNIWKSCCDQGRDIFRSTILDVYSVLHWRQLVGLWTKEILAFICIGLYPLERRLIRSPIIWSVSSWNFLTISTINIFPSSYKKYNSNFF